MRRLLIHVEGQTEETFVNEVLAPYLHKCGCVAAGARLIGNARNRSQRGGIPPWPSARRDLVRHIRQDSNCVSTLMVDYYGLPTAEGIGWPGRADADALSFEQKAGLVETELSKDIANAVGRHVANRQFVPFVLMHEFEGLLFSDCSAFADAIGLPEREADFADIRSQFETPENINDSPQTAPSKRILSLVPGYQKPFMGCLAALAVGLDSMRAECFHFDRWVQRLEDILGACNC